jgi:hypothetical protein
VRSPFPRAALVVGSDAGGTDVQGARAVTGMVLRDRAFRGLSREQDRLVGGLQRGAPACRLPSQVQRLGDPLSVKPHQHVAQFEPSFFKAARKAVSGSWCAECR